jgi:DNA-binding NarL/FixJ family response regulator
VCPACHRKWLDTLLPRGSGKQLTLRQIEILRQLCQGHSNKIIAYRLGMTENTVKTHLKEIFRRIGARNRAEAVRLAFKTWPNFKET